MKVLLFDIDGVLNDHTWNPVIDALSSGADYVLVVGRLPKVYIGKCLVEPYTLAELKLIPNSFKVVWNTRDLKTGGMKEETFEEARSVFDGWLCQASNIKTKSDVKTGADAIIVGQHLVEFIGK